MDDARLHGARFFDVARYLLQKGFLAHRGNFYDHGAGLIDGAAHHRIVCSFLNGHGFSGDNTFVHAGDALNNLAIHRNLLTGSYPHPVSHFQLTDFHLHFPAIGFDALGGIRLQIQQPVYRSGSPRPQLIRRPAGKDMIGGNEHRDGKEIDRGKRGNEESGHAAGQPGKRPKLQQIVLIENPAAQ